MLSEQLNQPSPTIHLQERNCQTCNHPLAIELRSVSAHIDEVFYFCINKPCPMHGEAQ